MKSGLYVSPGWSAAAMDAAWANWLPVPTTNSPNVLRGLKCRPLLLVSVGNDGSIMESPPPSFVDRATCARVDNCAQTYQQLFTLISRPRWGVEPLSLGLFGRSGNLR